jgi:hypothetical protein
MAAPHPRARLKVRPSRRLTAGNTQDRAINAHTVAIRWLGSVFVNVEFAAGRPNRGRGRGSSACVHRRRTAPTARPTPNTAHATTPRFNAEQLGASESPNDWCHHDPEQHRSVMVLETTS